MSSQAGVRTALADYPLSLQSAAQALWGDDFWGGPIPKAKPPKAPPLPRGRRKRFG